MRGQKRKIKIEQIKQDRDRIVKHWRQIILICLLLVILQSQPYGICTMRAFCGIPCPACGMTRAALLFFQGKFQESFAMHPLWILILLGILLVLYHRYIGLSHSLFIYIYGGFLVVALLVVYYYRMKYDFPMKPPMVYYKDNLLFYLYSIVKGKT